MHVSDYTYVRSRSRKLVAFGDPIVMALMQLIPAAGQAITGGIKQATTPPSIESENIIQNYNPPPPSGDSLFSTRNVVLAGGAALLLVGIISFARK